MPYVEGRVVHDADSHVMETPDAFAPYADPGVREKLQPLYVSTVAPGEEDHVEVLRRKFADPDYVAAAETEIMTRKNWRAVGSFIAEHRPRALDQLGFASQLVFNTFANKYLLRSERGDDLDFAYGLARAHNRAIVDFCSVDPRLLAACYVPLADFERSAGFAGEAIELGAAALLVPSACPARHSPSHPGLYPVWAQAQEAGLPIVFHVGGGGELVDPRYFENGRPPVPDFHGGEENFRSVDYMGIPHPPVKTLSTMIFDGVFDDFPALRVGVIEQGASWVPSWMRQLDSAHDAFVRNEERLQKLQLKASDYVLRHVRATPYPAEDVGWTIANSGPQVCLFSSDWPHVEGGRNPLARFERSMDDAGLGEDVKQRFYCDNFADLMGRALDRVPVA